MVGAVVGCSYAFNGFTVVGVVVASGGFCHKLVLADAGISR